MTADVLDRTLSLDRFCRAVLQDVNLHTHHARSVMIAAYMAAYNGEDDLLDAAVNGSVTKEIASRWGAYYARAGVLLTEYGNG